MGFIGKKWNELVYTLTSNDRYAGYHYSKAVKSLTTNDANLPNGYNDKGTDDHNDNNYDSDDGKHHVRNHEKKVDSADDDDDDDSDVELDDAVAGNNTFIKTNKYAKFKIDDTQYSVDEKQQAKIVVDAWQIIEDVINMDMNYGGDDDDERNNFFELNIEDEVDIEEIPDSEDFMNSLSSPCTVKDLQVAQKHLDVRLPYAVIQYFLIHDGQELPPSSTRKMGIMYGLQLLSLAEVITMTNHWRRVARKEANARYLAMKNEKATSIKGPNTTASANTYLEATKESDDHSDLEEQEQEVKEELIIDNDPTFKFANKINQITEKDLRNYPDLVRNMSTHSKNDYIKKLPTQCSYPLKKVKCQYANANWIPLVTDNTGNNIAIDLDPDVEGTVGQVILFGREFDTKYVIADNWGQFMSSFARDFKDHKRCKLEYDDDLGQFDLVYLDKNGNTVDQGYMWVLAQRVLGKNI